MNLKILYLFAKVFSATLRGVASLGGNISKQSVKVSPQKSERFLPRKFPASLYIHLLLCDMEVHASLPWLLLSTVY